MKLTLVPCTVRSVLLLVGGAASAATPYVGRPVLDFTYDRDPPLRMPTAVAVGADGTVYVTDGVHDRILVFSAEGELREEIRQVGEAALARPLSMKLDGHGRLWIADTGNHRVVIRAGDGSLAGTVEPDKGAADHAPDVTDLAPAADGQSAWLVDNDNNRLIRVDLPGGTQTIVGGKGESLGQFHYPYMVALGRAGDVLVTDAINARVQVISARGRPVGRLGTYGVGLSEFHRPKGIACDADGLVWVSDGTSGVVQVFEPVGGLRDVLRDVAGKPLKFDMPEGLAFDTNGDLYVVELLANRVRKCAITVDRAAVAPGWAAAPPGSATGAQARACTTCHIEWMEPFAQGRGTELMAVPVGTTDQPVVSRMEMCLSCHDGSVVDSRRRVWQEHGHGTGIAPPPEMKVPANLPLVEGRVACRTCHSAHTTGAPTGDISGAIFLRVQNKASELCMGCHPDKTRGPELGTHPTGGMPWPVPQTLLDAGARVGPNPRELTCQVCHTPHGASHEHLLVLGTETNQLCLSCHEQMRPGMFREGAAEHPLSPQVNSAQAVAVREMGTKLGPGEHLICLSCHKLHHGKGQRYMLADDLHDGQLCLRCHEERRTMLGSSHDLRSRFPEERNRLGMTAESGGPCSSCHLFHRYARAPEASPIDPGGGKCITCHQLGRVAQTKTLGPVNHPAQAACTGCHNPHEVRFGNYFAAQPVQVCHTCHSDYGAVVGGPHDVTKAAGTWPTTSTAAKDVCLSCHRPHGTEETGLFRAGLVADVRGPDARCLPCHADVAVGSNTPHALLHPRDVKRLRMPTGAPLVDVDGTPQIACKSCHNPHRGGAANPSLLRVATGQEPAQACVACHTEAANLHAIGHAEGPLRAAGFQPVVCGPCHEPHGSRETVAARYLWPKQLMYQTDSALGERSTYCLGCHREGGPVAPPTIATHPKAEMFNATALDAAGYLPLFDTRGEVDPRGSIACETCHLTHGRATPIPLPTELRGANTREVRARQWHLRSFGSESVCTTCHGADALRRFMYFHDPARRGGPITAGTAPGAVRGG